MRANNLLRQTHGGKKNNDSRQQDPQLEIIIFTKAGGNSCLVITGLDLSAVPGVTLNKTPDAGVAEAGRGGGDKSPCSPSQRAGAAAVPMLPALGRFLEPSLLTHVCGFVPLGPEPGDLNSLPRATVILLKS